MVKKQSAQKSSKKQKGAGSSNPTAPVLIPFAINPKHPHFWKMNFLPERDYDMKNVHPSFEATVQGLQWEGFVQHRTYYLEQMVREFYAGLITTEGEIKTEQSMVRGRKVFFDEETINKFYNLQYSGNDFNTKLEIYGKKKMEQIKNRIAVPNAKWEKITHTECKMKIRYLVPELSNWHTFINCSIMPTSNNYTLSKDRLIILDSILTDENINIGKIINKEIRDCARKLEGFLFFPCLITALCMKHKVQISENEHGQSKYPPSALSAQMKARRIITNPEELKKKQEMPKQEVLKHDDSKEKAIRKYLWEQHEWLEVRLAEISQTPTCLEMPEFPIWVFDDIDDEETSEEEEEVVEKKKKELKRKKETVRKGKGKKKKVEIVSIDSDETEEEEEVNEELKE